MTSEEFKSFKKKLEKYKETDEYKQKRKERLLMIHKTLNSDAFKAAMWCLYGMAKDSNEP